MATYNDIQAALTTQFINVNTNVLSDLPTHYYLRDFDPDSVTGPVFISENFLFNTQDALNKTSLDEVTGIYQLSVYLRAGESPSLLDTVVDGILINFKYATTFVYNSQKVVIMNAGRNQARHNGGWYVVDLSINFKSDIPR